MAKRQKADDLDLARNPVAWPLMHILEDADVPDLIATWGIVLHERYDTAHEITIALKGANALGPVGKDFEADAACLQRAVPALERAGYWVERGYMTNTPLLYVYDCLEARELAHGRSSRLAVGCPIQREGLSTLGTIVRYTSRHVYARWPHPGKARGHAITRHPRQALGVYINDLTAPAFIRSHDAAVAA